MWRGLRWSSTLAPLSTALAFGCSDAASGSTSAGSTSAGSASEAAGRELGPDECSDAVASGIFVQDIVAYQVVGIPLMDAGVEVATEQRIADIVAQRELVMRVNVDAGEGWDPRVLSARVEVELPDASTELFFAKRFVEGSSVPGDPASSFLVGAPADVVAEGSNYSISLVECEREGPGGTVDGARFPSSGNAALGAVRTGPIKVHIVPFRVAGFVPETTPEILDGFASAVRAMYPTPEVVLSVGEVFDDGETVDMGQHLVRLGQLRDQDRPPVDVYYYGLISGAETREEFCSSCPTGSSEEAGQLHVGFAVGAAFGDDRSESTFVHELGHMHGRRHSPCGGPNRLDEDYPYPAGDIHVEGYDSRSGEFVPASTHDVMGYCQPRWVSDYTYRALAAWMEKWNAP